MYFFCWNCFRMGGLGTHLCANDDCLAKERRIKVGRRTTEKAFLRGEGAGDNSVSVTFAQEEYPS